MIKKLKITFPDKHTVFYDFDFSEGGTIKDMSLRKIISMQWVNLDYHKCSSCSLPSSPYAICPVASVLAQYSIELAEYASFLKVDVEITEEDRLTYIDQIPLQKVVGELVRFAVFHTHCPVGVRFKSVMNALRPFPDNSEILRAFVTFFAIYGLSDDIELTAEQKIFVDTLHDLFSNLAKRLKSFGTGDAHLNGVVIVDTISMMFRLTSSELLYKTIGSIRKLSSEGLRNPKS